MNQIIKETLAPLNISISYVTANNDASEYIIFNDFNQGSSLRADDREVATNYFVQLDIFSDGNFLELARLTKDLMEAEGFQRIYESPGDYEVDMKRFRKTYRFIYADEYMKEDIINGS